MKRVVLKGLSLILVLAICLAFSPLTASARTAHDEAAGKLNSLGLFQGVGTNTDGTPDYDLDRAPTRYEAVTMLVRLLGQESEATNADWVTPFTDVADWAKPYVGYAYTYGLTTGTSDTTFSGGDTITASQYLTFVLRALGYVSGEDFKWDSAWSLSDALGFTEGQYNETTATFLRSDVASISFDALSAYMKDHDVQLYSDLIYNGVISASDAENAGLFRAVADSYNTDAPEPGSESNDEEDDEDTESQPGETQEPVEQKNTYDAIARDYEWYMPQYGTSDCGPTCAAMAAKWVDSSFNKTPQELRKEITPENTGWWYTSDITEFFTKYGIDNKIKRYATTENMKAELDNGNIMILCMDTTYITRNFDYESHFGKYYSISGGHFLVVKGYMTDSDGKFYFEVYDPNSYWHEYEDGTPMGKDRYYLDSDLVASAVNWWDYFIVVYNPVSVAPAGYNSNSNILYMPNATEYKEFAA